MRVHETTQFDIVSEDGIRAILGIRKPIPLSPVAMARDLRVTFFPVEAASERVRRFCSKLHKAFSDVGVTVIKFEDALDAGRPDKVTEGVVIIAAGDLRTGNLPVDHVSNLRTTTIVGIVDGPCPADLAMTSQEKLNRIVRTLAWNIVQGIIYVDDASWTLCTMNGAIVRCANGAAMDREVFSTLVPKLAAPVVPPHAADFDLREGTLDLGAEEFAPYVRDFLQSGDLWSRTGLLLFHTSMESLEFRNAFYKRVAAAYLDNRSGMSYGFLARQLPSPIRPALTVQEAERQYGGVEWTENGMVRLRDSLHAVVHVNGEAYATEVPEVRVLTTRSGCDKSNIDPARDLTLMELIGGRVVFRTPGGMSVRVDSRPSYDTLVILAHAVGNAIIASVQARVAPSGLFATMFQRSGMALAHWHGQVDSSSLPDGYFIHGEGNPPVSCSTYQSAMYALTGKLSTFVKSLTQRVEFSGDVHIEPHHGTNVTGPSLVALARWALSNAESFAEARA